MFRRTVLALGTAALMAGPALAESHSMDIVDTAAGAGNFNTLVTAIEAAGLTETLKGEGPFTVFAPNDDAFAALPAGTLDTLLADPEALAAILTYHVVPGAVMSTDIEEGIMPVTTVNGAEATVTNSDDVISIDDATVIGADMSASNGVIHEIDAVIMPQ